MQFGFFDHQERLNLLERLGDPLPKLQRSVDWEAFRSELEKVYKQGNPRKRCRPPFDAVLMFKVLVFQYLYRFSDDQTEFQIRDRYSFCRFLDLFPEGGVPNARTIWLFRERVKQTKLIENLFDEVLVQIERAGLTACKGHIVDAALVPVLKQRNTLEENACIKTGEVPDSQVFEALLDEHSSNADVWADAAYSSSEREVELRQVRYRSHIHRKGTRARPLNARGQEANRKRSSVRARVEDVLLRRPTGWCVRLVWSEQR